MGLIFNGKSSRDFGLIISKYPPLNHGVKRGEAYTIAGRNGTFYREDGTYDNYIQPYEVAIREKNRRADLRAADVAAWLLGSSGFCRLEDTFEPEYFKMARYAGALNIEQILGKYGKATLEFDCQPERWLKNGEDVQTLIAGVNTIYNPTAFKAKPLIKMYGGGSMVLSVNDTEYFSVYETAESWCCVIDCETGEITDDDGVSKIASTTFYTRYNDFPVLESGINTFEFDSNTDTIEIIPRWWTL